MAQGVDVGERAEHRAGTRKKSRKAGNIVLGSVGGVLVAGGIALLLGVWLMPDTVEKGYGALKTGYRGTVDKVQEQVFDEYPTVALGVTGDETDLDIACNAGDTYHTFTIMKSYERDGVPETAAAHNNCGGDVLLPWEEGQKINIEGDDMDGLYEIIDIRYTPKIWATTEDLIGLEGDLALQTCFYGEDRMKFIGLEKVEES